MNEETFSPEQSLKVIQSMLEKTKQDFSENAFYLLLWGWLIFIAAISEYCLMKFFNYPQHYLVWNLMWIGAIISVVAGIRKGRKKKVETYMDRTMMYFGIGCGFMFSILVFIFSYYKLWEYVFPIYFLLFGFLSFISGAIIRYVPLRWAGAFCWAISIVSVFAKYDVQLLLMGLVILVSYIIPGYLIKKEYKKQTLEA